MDLKNISDDTLLAQTQELVSKERSILIKVLWHLREIERRRLFSKLKYSSLFQYAVEHLGYPEDQADRRIAAMRLLRELPQLSDQIISGALNLTQLGMARALFNKQRKSGNAYSSAQKLAVLARLATRSVREGARIIAAIAPESVRCDKIRAISSNQIEIRFTADAGLQTKLENLKGLLAHSAPGISMGELIDKLCDLGAEQWSKTKCKTSLNGGATKARGDASKTAAPRNPKGQTGEIMSSPTKIHPSQAEIRRSVWARDKACVNCGSSFAMELDHQIPKALGGSSEPENLRILCRNCNQRAAIEAFGIEKMGRYLRSPQVKYGLSAPRTVVVVVGDQPSTSSISKVRNRPLPDNKKAIFEADQIVNVN